MIMIQIQKSAKAHLNTYAFYLVSVRESPFLGFATFENILRVTINDSF